MKRLYAARAPFVSWCSLLHDHIYVSQISPCASKVLVLAVIFLLYTDGLDVTWAAWCGSDVECVEKKKRTHLEMKSLTRDYGFIYPALNALLNFHLWEGYVLKG